MVCDVHDVIVIGHLRTAAARYLATSFQPGFLGCRRKTGLRQTLRVGMVELWSSERSATPRRWSSYDERGYVEMPFSFFVDESKKVFHVRAGGEITDAELMDLTGRLRQEVAYIAGYPMLCDCSALTGVWVSSSVIESLAKAARPRTNLLAVIAPSAVAFGLARMYQIFSDPEDRRIRVFAKAKEAMAWLNAGMRETTMHA